MDRYKLYSTIATIVLLLSSNAIAGPLETVSLAGGGGTHQGADNINAAITAVDNGGIVRIIQSGTYAVTTPVIVIGGKNYTIEASVPGVILDNPSTVAGSVTLDTRTATDVASTLSLTLKNFTIVGGHSTGNTSYPVRIFQHNTAPTTITMDNMKVLVDPTLAANGNRCFFVQIGGQANGGSMHLDFTSCSLRSAGDQPGPNGTPAGVGGGNGILINGTAANMTALSANLTSCTIISPNSEMVWTAAGANQKWNVTNCVLEGRGNLNFRVRNAHANCQFNFTDTTFRTRREVIRAADAPAATESNNVFTFTRCTLDQDTYGQDADTDNLLRLEYPLGTGNALNLYNCLLITRFRTGGTNAAISTLGGVASTLYHCTVLAGGNGTPVGLRAGTPGSITVANSIVGNFTDPVDAATTISSPVGNMVVGPTDDALLGTHVYVNSAAGLSAALTAAKLNATTYIPDIDSAASNAADTNLTIRAAIEGVDRVKKVRLANSPDIGAFEGDALPPPNSIQGWILYN